MGSSGKRIIEWFISSETVPVEAFDGALVASYVRTLRTSMFLAKLFALEGNDRLVSRRRTPYCVRRPLWSPSTGTSVAYSGVTSITIADESSLIALMSNDLMIGSKFAFSTAALIARESSATFT